jgi:hypothetical protein
MPSSMLLGLYWAFVELVQTHQLDHLPEARDNYFATKYC